MGPTMLKREVLPPRQAPPASHDFASDEQVRATITRAIWTSAALVGLANAIARMLETGL